MKRYILFFILSCLATIQMGAQTATNARKILDKTAAVVSNKSGATATFSTSGKLGKSSGNIWVKGNKFQARTAEGIVWYDGRTQWTYSKASEEVNISTPTAAQQQAMNPYKFITLYKKGYNLSLTEQSKNYVVRMVAQSRQQAIQEMFITISRANYQPLQVRMRQSNGWTTINISSFKAVRLNDSMFRFNSKDFPRAEIIDLR